MSSIRKFAVSETGVLNLTDADDEPMIGDDGKPMSITLFGPGSKEYARANAANQNRLVDKLKKKGKTDQSAADRAREQSEFLAACTKDMSANIEYDAPGGEKLKGEELYKAIYSDITIGFVADQVAKFIGDWSNFSKASATTSAST
jgi:hypothetical protein